MAGQNGRGLGGGFSLILRLTLFCALIMCLFQCGHCKGDIEDGKSCISGLGELGIDPKARAAGDDAAKAYNANCKSGKCNWVKSEKSFICGSTSIQAVSGLIAIVLLVGLCLRQVVS